MGENLSDLGNARRLVGQHGQDLRYLPAFKQWRLYDERRWAADDRLRIESRAKEVIRSIYAEAQACADAKERARIGAWALASENARAIARMIEVARSEPGVAVTPNEFDADPWLFNVANGTLDLRTGELRPHRREDLLTKLSPIRYDPAASCPRWLVFLARVLDDDADLLGVLQRAVGYTLVGLPREQAFFFLFGLGANGKSTFLEILRRLFGEYCARAEFGTFLESGQSGPRNDIARLAGARLVLAAEARAGARFDEALLKSLTGGDEITARFLYSEAFTFTPQFALWFAANHRPEIRGSEHAIWRRVRLLPFTVEIPQDEQDHNLVDRLTEELSGILAWAVEGCLEWQRTGLGQANAMVAAVADYREECDALAGFLAEECELVPAGRVTAADLFTRYQAWAHRTNESVLSQKALGSRLTDRGLQRVRGTKRRWVWHGIRLANEGRGTHVPIQHAFPDTPQGRAIGETIEGDRYQWVPPGTGEEEMIEPQAIEADST